MWIWPSISALALVSDQEDVLAFPLENPRQTAAYLVQTGRNPSDRVVHPSVGAVISLFKGKGGNPNR